MTTHRHNNNSVLWQLAGVLVFTLASLLTACGESGSTAFVDTSQGDPERGKLLFWGFGCGSCHAIKGVPLAQGVVGPPLSQLRQRAYIAGVLPHTRENLVRWIMDPVEIDPRTAMPDVGVNEADAQDIAAFLYGH